MKAVAADPPLHPPALRQRVRRRLRGQRRVERRVEDGHLRDIRHRRARAAGSPASAGRVVERRELSQRLQLALHGVVDQHRRRGSAAPPWTTRWPTASTSPWRLLERGDRLLVSSSPTRESLRLVEPALTTRTLSAQRPGPVARFRARPRRARASRRGARGGASSIACRSRAATSTSPGTRSITSMTRWNRSRSLSITMSKGVVVVPSSL